MNQAGDLPSQGALRLTRARIGLAFLHKTFDLRLRQEREHLQQVLHLAVRAVEPELVELVWAQHSAVKPDGVAFGLAELLTLSVGDNRAGEHVHIHATYLVDQVKTGREVAPLVGSAKLKHAMVFVEQVHEVVALQHLVAELGEGNAIFRIQPTGNGVFGEHGTQTEVLADVTQEVDDVHGGRPIVIGHETDRIAAFHFENAADLRFQTLGPTSHDVFRIERTFARLARIADQAGGAADQGNRMMACCLKVTHVDELHQIANMQRGSSRVETAIIGNGISVQRFGESIPVSGLGNQPAPFQFIEDGLETGLLEIDDVSHSCVFSLLNCG